MGELTAKMEMSLKVLGTVRDDYHNQKREAADHAQRFVDASSALESAKDHAAAFESEKEGKEAEQRKWTNVIGNVIRPLEESDLTSAKRRSLVNRLEQAFALLGIDAAKDALLFVMYKALMKTEGRSKLELAAIEHGESLFAARVQEFNQWPAGDADQEVASRAAAVAAAEQVLREAEGRFAAANEAVDVAHRALEAHEESHKANEAKLAELVGTMRREPLATLAEARSRERAFRDVFTSFERLRARSRPPSLRAHEAGSVVGGEGGSSAAVPLPLALPPLAAKEGTARSNTRSGSRAAKQAKNVIRPSVVAAPVTPARGERVDASLLLVPRAVEEGSPENEAGVEVD